MFQNLILYLLKILSSQGGWHDHVIASDLFPSNVTGSTNWKNSALFLFFWQWQFLSRTKKERKKERKKKQWERLTSFYIMILKGTSSSYIISDSKIIIIIIIIIIITLIHYKQYSLVILCCIILGESLKVLKKLL